MIIHRETGLMVEKPAVIDKHTKTQLDQIRKAERYSELVFVVPKGIDVNKDKTVYKSGFLFEFLRKLYPEETYDTICETMNTRYQVFLGRRQIERNVKEYNEKFN